MEDKEEEEDELEARAALRSSDEPLSAEYVRAHEWAVDVLLDDGLAKGHGVVALSLLELPAVAVELGATCTVWLCAE